MADKPVWQKLLIKPGRTLLAVNAPENIAGLLGGLPEGVTFSPPDLPTVDGILLFVRTRAELETDLPALKSRLTPGGLLWVFYYKLTSSRAADIHRDSINAYAMTLGLRGIAMISVDEHWSALRLKPLTT